MSQVLRATFEAVFSAQEKLRKHLDVLISENRPLRDETEKDLFMRELSYGTLGLGFEQNIIYYSEKHGALIRKDLETTARWLSYQTIENVDVPSILFSEGLIKENVPIGRLWMLLRDNLFTIFPLALKLSVSMSREQEGQRKTTGYKVQEDTP